LLGGADAESLARQDWKEQQNKKRIQEQQEFRAWQVEQQKLRQRVREEGRSLITEFTPEEQEERRREADKAAQQERELLSQGIEQLGKKYWQLDANAANHGKDILELAVNSLKEVETKPDGEAEEILAESLPPAPSVNEGGSEQVESQEVSEKQDEEEVVTPVIETNVVLPPAPPSEEELRQQQLLREAREKEEREEDERQQRIADSFEIYKRQLEAKKQNPHATTSNYHYSNTWNSAASASSASIPDEEESRPLYWSEVMDLELAKQVKSNLFDFDAISNCMIEKANARKLDNSIVHNNPSLLSNEICRLRWSELDANNWSLPAPGVTAKDTIFRINLNDDILQQTGGAQPSYEALANLAKSSKPNYLKVPTAFPSVSAQEDDMEELD
jgi:hypothetical protein